MLDRVASIGLCYLAEVPHDTRVWSRRPSTEIPPAKGKGRRPSRERLSRGEPAAVRVDQLAKELPSAQWMRLVLKEGAKGPMVADFAFLRAVAIRDDLPWPAVWVVLRRSLGEKQELMVYLSNAAEEAQKEAFVRISGMRWPVESAILESKSELGMDHYEVRTWVGWHHHMTMTMLAHHFLVRLRVRMGKKAAALSVPQARQLLNAVLPKKRLDAKSTLALVLRQQRQNFAAYCCHHQHTLRKLDGS